ncbi:MAG: hypothetical protein AMXMBFR53_25530 [Gemmatimonadota bacterium]
MPPARTALALALAPVVVLLGPTGARAQNVLVAYHTVTGHTRLMAEAVAEGASGVADARVRLVSVEEATADDLAWADAVVLGSPVRTGNPSPEALAFLGGMPFDGRMKDKVGAAFVSGGGISAGEELTQMAILSAMLVYGMIVVGGPEWTSAFGASAVTEEITGAPAPTEGSVPVVEERFLAKGRALGRRVAGVAARLAR